MFYCSVLKKLSEPGEKPLRLPIMYREKTYFKTIRDEETRRLIEVVAGTGYEIVKEILVSQEGARVWAEQNPNGPTWEE